MYRQIDTGTWDDPWFAEINPDAKLLFLYMLTNRRSTAAGVFEITLRAMSFETGMDTKRVTAALESISTRVRWWPEHQTIWVRNFLRHQAPSPNLFKSAWNEMLPQPEKIRDEVGVTYPLLTDDNPPPETKEEIQALMEGYAKGSQRVPDGSRKTSLDKSSTSLEETSRLEGDADAPTPPKPRASRLPDDFAVTDDMREWARSEGATDRLIDFETDKFRDYWPTVPGQKGVKLDWGKTWKNWIRRAISDAPAGTLRRVGDDDNPYAGRFNPMTSMTPEEKAAYNQALAEAIKCDEEAERQRRAG